MTECQNAICQLGTGSLPHSLLCLAGSYTLASGKNGTGFQHVIAIIVGVLSECIDIDIRDTAAASGLIFLPNLENYYMNPVGLNTGRWVSFRRVTTLTAICAAGDDLRADVSRVRGACDTLLQLKRLPLQTHV